MELSTFFDSVLRIIIKKRWNNPGIISHGFVSKAMKIGKLFSEKERVFFIELLERFEVYPEPHYQEYLVRLLNRLNIKEHNVYFAPLLSRVDLGNPWKSSYFVSRFMNSTYIQQQPIFSEKNIKEFTDDCLLDDYKLVLLDDFVGTGYTAHSCVSYYVEKGIPKDRIIVMAFVVMEAGLKKMKKENICLNYLFLEKKGISGRYPERDAQKRITINQKICLRYNIEHPLGFCRSQALVCLQRTPNNTFPIFWDERMTSVLFPRGSK